MLSKLGHYEGNLNRSLMFVYEEDAKAFFDKLQLEEEYIPKQYLSATKTGIYNEEAQIQMYIANAKKGKDLRSLNEMENEVLYPKKSKFIVRNKAEQDGVYFILLEEA